jgi:tellurium resistance protein TerZ
MAINLQKGQKISLEKEAGGGLTKIVMGLGWDAKKKSGGFFGGGSASVDLDASCVLFDETQKIRDAVWFAQLQSKDGSIVHTGDNRTGDGDGDDEQIIVDLTKVPADVKSLMFVVNSFTGQSFSDIENAFCRVLNGSSLAELARYELSCGGSHTAMLMAKVYRHNGEWKMHAIGENCSGRTFSDMLPVMQGQL